MKVEIIKHEISYRKLKLKRLVRKSRYLRVHLNNNFKYISKIETELKHLNNRLRETENNDCENI